MDCINICKAEVLKSETLVECSNDSFTPNGLNGPFVGKIPVVLAEPIIQIDLESEIKLEEPALEIKRIKKNLFLTQCKLIATGYDRECPKTGKLFLSGYVRKNIEYATADCKSGCKGGISGKIHHTTVNIPFRCVTKVTFDNTPKISEKGYSKEIASLLGETKGHEYCDQKIMGQDPCEINFEHVEYFNEKVYCELEEARIYENDTIVEPRCYDCGFKGEYTFDKIIEKMVIYVRIKLLQNQQVNIPGKAHFDDCK